MANRTGKKFGGRKKGVPNKQTKSVKKNIYLVFRRSGGVKEMVKWAKDHRSEFYTKILTKLVPESLEHSGPEGQVMRIETADYSKYCKIRPPKAKE